MSQIPFPESEAIILFDTNLLSKYSFAELIREFPDSLSLIWERIRDYKSKERKREIVVSRYLICLLARYWGVEIEYFDSVLGQKIVCLSQRDIILKRRMFASISHSLNWLAVGISSLNSIAVDIHSRDRGYEKVLRVVRKIFPQLPLIEDDVETPTFVWTLYECFKKLGINDFSNVSLLIKMALGLFKGNRTYDKSGFSVYLDMFNLYCWFIDCSTIMGSLVVQCRDDQNRDLSIYFVERIDPRETSFTRA